MTNEIKNQKKKDAIKRPSSCNCSTPFKSGIWAILGIDLESMVNNFLELKEMKTDKIIEILEYSKKEEFESTTVNTKRMMCIQELCDRGEEHRIINLGSKA